MRRIFSFKNIEIIITETIGVSREILEQVLVLVKLKALFHKINANAVGNRAIYAKPIRELIEILVYRPYTGINKARDKNPNRLNRPKTERKIKEKIFIFIGSQLYLRS